MPPQTMNTLAIVFAVAALTPIGVDLLRRWIVIPSVAVEIVLGIVIGPQVLGLAHDDTIITFVADVGLALLMFLAGFEIDFDRIRVPRRSWRGLAGWRRWYWVWCVAFWCTGSRSRRSWSASP